MRTVLSVGDSLAEKNLSALLLLLRAPMFEQLSYTLVRGRCELRSQSREKRKMNFVSSTLWMIKVSRHVFTLHVGVHISGCLRKLYAYMHISVYMRWWALNLSE
jgi:hypothetical protein